MLLFKWRLPSANLFDSKRNLILLMIFLLMLPKGGIKIHDIPITWGYCLLGLFALGAFFRNTLYIHRARLQTFFATLPFLLIAAGTMAINGVESLGMVISFWISFFFLPIFFLCLFSQDIETLNEELFFRWFSRGIFFIAVYGILLFALKQISGKFLEIPLLTINLGDWGGLENKCINRGSVFKLISTYNNGNLYGVCLVMLLPLYYFLEKKEWRIWIIRLSLLLTMSRTVWIGLVFHEIGYQWISSKNKKRFLKRILSFLGIFCGLLILISVRYSFYLDFFTDANLGGRKAQLLALSQTGLFSTTPFDSIGEIVYAGVLSSFGWLGFLAFLLAMAGPLLLQITTRKLSLFHQCIALGLVNYLFISAADGAILLLPTMAFYWFLLSLLIKTPFNTLYVAQEMPNGIGTH
jgi:hypothetical protein